jgi:hypothetical protein
LNFQAVLLHQFLQECSFGYSFEPFLFLQPRHLLLQEGKEVWVIFAEKNQTIVAMMSLFLENEVAYSPLRMSFGGIASSADLSYADTEQLVDFLISFCKNQKIKTLRIASYPFSYAPDVSAMTTHIFLQKGFCITRYELTHFLILEGSFESRLHHSARRRLKKCRKHKFNFELWNNPNLRFVYDFIAQNRQRKNYPVSMSFESFQKTLTSFPENYLVFVLKNKAEIIALTVAVIINRDILYNFYPADKEEYLSYSPMIMLLEGVYHFAQKQGFRLLDLGISTENSLPNYGLIRFKENLGSCSALKLSFEKQIVSDEL